MFRLCKEKKWTSSRLILALPQGSRRFEGVIFHEFQKTLTVDSILLKINHHLASQVMQIRTIQRLQNWMKFSDDHSTNVRVILFSTQQFCPMFFSALAIKFHDRVPFAIVHVTKDDIKEFLNKSKFPFYAVISPEGTYTYGSLKGESFNFKSMELFLNSFVPNMSDVCWLSFILINALASFELFFINNKQKFLNHLLLYIVTAVKYNCYLVVVLVLYTIMRNALIVVDCINILQKCLRLISGSYIASLIRSDCKHFYSYPLIAVTFPLFATIAGFILDKYEFLHVDSSQDVLRDYLPFLFGDWWKEMCTSSYFRARIPPPTLINTSPENEHGESSEEEENVDETPRSPTMAFNEPAEFLRLLEVLRNALPDLLQEPVVPVDCMKDLPQWKYQDSGIADKSNNANSEQTPKKIIDLQECSICQESYIQGQSLCGLPCGHNFHVNCITIWLTQYNHCCPLCRFKIVKTE